MKRIIPIISIFLLVIFSFSIKPIKTVNAQCTASCIVGSLDCEKKCSPTNEWFCSGDIGFSGVCCLCVNGPGTYGPRICGNDPTEKDVYGCAPNPPSPPPPPTITSAPVICCIGDFAGCEDHKTYDACVTDPHDCVWDSKTNPAQCPAPPPGAYICTHPGAAGSAKCEPYDQTCPNPDTPGAACWTTLNKCVADCVTVPGISITEKPALNLLTPCAQKGVFNAIDTAIGCFPTSDRNEMLVFILRWALGVGSGITFLLIVYSGFLIMASGGNAERVKAGKELLTAAVTGIILLIFSVFILDFLGLRILRIPGL